MLKSGAILGKVINTWTQKPFFLMLAGVMLSQMALADKATLLEKDQDALQARVDLIQQAKTEINAEYFYVGSDPQSMGGIALLLNAAQHGVKVKVIIDDLENHVPRAIFSILDQMGKDKEGHQNFEVRTYNPIGINLLRSSHRDHAKILVADSKRVISGGRNVGSEYFGLNKNRNFEDLDVIAEGDVARQAHDNFMQVWESDLIFKIPLYQYSEGKVAEDGCVGQGDQQHCQFIREDAIKKIAEFKTNLARVLEEIQAKQDDDIVNNEDGKDWFSDRENSIQAEFISHDPKVFNSDEHDLLSVRLLEILKNAQTDANIVSPYLIPTPALMAVFKELKKRGVRVRVITNSLQSTDNLFAQAGYRSLRKEMINMGLEIYEYKGPNTVHAKTAVVDNKIALIGTFNLDPRSTHLNREVAIKMTDSNNNKIVDELTSSIEVFRSKSTLIAKDGIEYNADRQFVGVSKKKKIILKVLNILMPFIKSQL